MQAQAADAVEADFPGWHAWQSDTGRWWATRTGTAAQWDDEGGTPMTVDADSADGIRAVLTELAGA